MNHKLHGAPSAFKPLRGLGMALLLGWTVHAHAALFGDDEARRAILDLRAKVDAHRQTSDDAERELRDGVDATRRGLLDLVGQLDTLRAEVAQLRGQNEQLARELADIQRRQKDVLGAVDERLRVLEPVKVTLDGQEFVVQPEEKNAFEAAMVVLRNSDFTKAAQLYGQFMERYPASAYVPLALYWQGNALYAARSYKPAIASYMKLVEQAPKHPRVPEAKLAMANCQLELKDLKAAQATLQALVKAHPETEAGATARDRLARMK